MKFNMRRIDLHSKRKLKNPGRHLRSLKRWSEAVHLSFEDGVIPHSDEMYWNIRLPVYAKICDPPHTKPEYQRACVEALMLAAVNIRAYAKIERPYKLAVLFQTPNMHLSEVTLFFDLDYLRSFYPTETYGVTENDVCRVTSLPPQLEQVDSLNLRIPQQFAFLGGHRIIDEDKFSDGLTLDYNRWVIVERD
jgi:hypothetical protein